MYEYVFLVADVNSLYALLILWINCVAYTPYGFSDIKIFVGLIK